MKTLVIGAGKSGVAAANFLARRGGEVLLTDSNDNPTLPCPLHDNVAASVANSTGVGVWTPRCSARSGPTVSPANSLAKATVVRRSFSESGSRTPGTV